MIVIANAFSLNMITLDRVTHVHVVPTDVEGVKAMIEAMIEAYGGFESIVGHADTAEVFSSLLGLTVPCNRATFKLEEGTTLVVGQYKGPRLPEGATTLPEGATVEWAIVTVA